MTNPKLVTRDLDQIDICEVLDYKTNSTHKENFFRRSSFDLHSWENNMCAREQNNTEIMSQ